MKQAPPPPRPPAHEQMWDGLAHGGRRSRDEDMAADVAWRGVAGAGLTMCGNWMLARLWMSDWLRLASSCSRESFCCSITLFSSSMDFRLLSMVVICGGGMWVTHTHTRRVA